MEWNELIVVLLARYSLWHRLSYHTIHGHHCIHLILIAYRRADDSLLVH
jgi:hypothetical protein